MIKKFVGVVVYGLFGKKENLRLKMKSTEVIRDNFKKDQIVDKCIQSLLGDDKMSVKTFLPFVEAFGGDVIEFQKLADSSDGRFRGPLYLMLLAAKHHD